MGKVYRIRNKKTGEFLSGGHSAQQGIFIGTKGAICSFRRLDKWHWEWEKEHRGDVPENYEIVEYDLVEVGTQPIPPKK